MVGTCSTHKRETNKGHDNVFIFQFFLCDCQFLKLGLRSGIVKVLVMTFAVFSS